MKIYEIDAAIAGLVDLETGEIKDYEAFAELSMARDQKIENMVLLLKNRMALSDDIKAEVAVLQGRKKVIDNSIRSLKEYIAHVLDGQKFETARCAVSYRKSEATETDKEFLEWAIENRPDLLEEQPPKLDLAGLKQMLKEGMECPYARIIEKNNIQIK